MTEEKASNAFFPAQEEISIEPQEQTAPAALSTLFQS
jgi:hypothetical protein